MFENLLEYNWYPNLHLNRNINSPPIAHFRFSNAVFRKEKSKKEKWQGSQNSDLKPTYGSVVVTGNVYINSKARLRSLQIKLL